MPISRHGAQAAQAPLSQDTLPQSPAATSRYYIEDDTHSTFRWFTQARASSYLTAPLSPNFCFGVTIDSLVTSDQVEVCPLLRLRSGQVSRGVMLPYERRNPYPPHYKEAFASSTILTRSPIGSPYGSLSPKGRTTGLPRSARVPARVRSLLPSVAFTLADELGSPWFPFRG